MEEAAFLAAVQGIVRRVHVQHDPLRLLPVPVQEQVHLQGIQPRGVRHDLLVAFPDVLAGGISTFDSIGSSLGVGITYGLSSFAGDFLAWPLPFWWTNTWWAYLWSIAVTATAMLIVTALRG